MAKRNSDHLFVIETSPDGGKRWFISFWGKNFFIHRREAVTERQTHCENFEAELDKPGFFKTLPKITLAKGVRFRVSTYMRKENKNE